MRIVKIDRQNITDINKANQPFEIIGRICPSYADGIWTYKEEIYEHPRIKTYQALDHNDHINDPDKAVFLAYSDTECVGQIALKSDWNGYAFVEDICVAGSARGKGIGTALIEKAVEWAKSRDLKGLALETQDNNLLACRFYAKCGFKIGAVNTMLYKNLGNDETAVFWYLLF